MMKLLNEKYSLIDTFILVAATIWLVAVMAMLA
jgi:hypothetical protein